jgi:hypothetical protein
MILRAERVGGELAAELRIVIASSGRAEAGESGCRRELHECATRDGHLREDPWNGIRGGCPDVNIHLLRYNGDQPGRSASANNLIIHRVP